MSDYGFTKELNLPFEKAVGMVREALRKEGFGMLTEVDVRETFKEKLGIDFKKYVILGACNPPYAHRALQSEENIGLLLPFNVVLYEKGRKTIVSFVRPTVTMGMIDNQPLKEVAAEVERKLRHVFDAVW